MREAAKKGLPGSLLLPLFGARERRGGTLGLSITGRAPREGGCAGALGFIAHMWRLKF